MIVDFQCGETEQIWRGQFSRKLPQDIQETALRKLRMLNNAKLLHDLSLPPNNHLEALKKDRIGQPCIRINSQWRIWTISRRFNPQRKGKGHSLAEPTKDSARFWTGISRP